MRRIVFSMLAGSSTCFRKMADVGPERSSYTNVLHVHVDPSFNGSTVSEVVYTCIDADPRHDVRYERDRICELWGQFTSIRLAYKC
jgi:hypothetical protein